MKTLLANSPPLSQAAASNPVRREAVRERLLWPDVARGFAIILVVLGHAIGGMVSSGQIAQGSFLQHTFYFIYTFHMALFFCLSGVFIERRVRAEPRKLLSDSFWYVAYPYFIWGLFQKIVITQLGGAVNTPYELSWRFLVSTAWTPPSQFWFLYVLFVYQLVALVVLPRARASWIVVAAFALCAIADLTGMKSVVATIFRFSPYYALGIWLGPWLLAGLKQWPHRLLIATAAALSWFGFAALSEWHDADFLSYSAIPAAILGSFAVIVAASLVKPPVASALVALGRNSMPIFLLHVLFVAGTRIAFRLFAGVTDVSIVLPSAVAIGIAGPLIAVTVARRWHVASWLGLAKD